MSVPSPIGFLQPITYHLLIADSVKILLMKELKLSRGQGKAPGFKTSSPIHPEPESGSGVQLAGTQG
jgi:hypothetical protein